MGNISLSSEELVRWTKILSEWCSVVDKDSVGKKRDRGNW